MSTAQAIATQRLERALLRARIHRKRTLDEKMARKSSSTTSVPSKSRSQRRQTSAADTSEVEELLVSCSVCMDALQPDDETLETLKCGHTFHGTCIASWLKRRQNCPLCRSAVGCGGSDAPTPSAAASSSRPPGLARPRRPHRCGNPNVLLLRSRGYCVSICLQQHYVVRDPQALPRPLLHP